MDSPQRPLSHQIASEVSIWMLSVLAGLFVCAGTIFLQWLVYDDWMHDSGPLRIVGSLLAGGLMCGLVARRKLNARKSKLEMLRRFETIRWMNDRIRNALQAIECVTFAAAPAATDEVRSAVDTIETVLHEVLSEAHPAKADARKLERAQLQASD